MFVDNQLARLWSVVTNGQQKRQFDHNQSQVLTCPAAAAARRLTAHEGHTGAHTIKSPLAVAGGDAKRPALTFQRRRG